jgi:ribose transport system ATP-binding protein
VTTPLLRMTGVSKAFSGVPALLDVSLDLFPGEVHALVGENGAGKSTLMKILAGVYTPDAGGIELDGAPVVVHNPRDSQARGVAIIHQELNTVPYLTVAENLALGAEPGRAGLLDRRTMRAQAVEKLTRIGARVPPDLPMGRLSVGVQQMVEIARAVSNDARILVLDEPTAALSQGETERLFELVEQMRAEGMGLVYITHRMEEVWRLADRITVLRDGRWVSTDARDDVTPGQVVTRMVGRDIAKVYVNEGRSAGKPVLSVENLEGFIEGRRVGPVSLIVREGEIVALVGLIGAGRSEIVRMIFGADRRTGGTVRLDGEPAEITGPGDAIASGLGLVPENRKEQALFLDLSVRDNTVMSSLDELSRGGVLRRARIRDVVREQVDRLRVRMSSPRQEVRGLSGGNQQKVVLARWLLRNPRVLVLDEPTRGVDVGAKQEIYRIINDLALRGVAVLLVSSDLPEALGISDRLLVVRQGRIVAELDGAEATEEEVMLHATGVAATHAAGKGDQAGTVNGVETEEVHR